MSLIRAAMGWQSTIFRQCLNRLADRADKKLRQGADDPGHRLAKTVAAAATLQELDEHEGIVTDLLCEEPHLEKGNQ